MKRDRVRSPLTHPAALAALLVLLVNDHVLRWHFSSAVTGKIGDVAWLFFAGILGAEVASALLPASFARFRQSIALVGMGVPAAVFVLAKCQPGFHAWINLTFERLVGGPSMLRLDVSDLMALPTLVLAWVVWKEVGAAKSQRRATGWVSLGLFSVLTIANSAAPDFGVVNLVALDRHVLAASAYECFLSGDGGLTWEAVNRDECAGAFDAQVAAAADPGDASRVWRIQPGEAIEVSTDGGTTWRDEFRLAPPGDAQQALVRRSRPGASFGGDGPFDVVVDPSSGHAIFAMGQEGVLVREGVSAWARIAVGRYEPPAAPTVGRAAALLVGEIVLAIDAGMLSLSALSLVGERRGRLVLFTAVAAVGWVLVLVLFRPARIGGSDYAMGILSPAIASVTVVSVVLAPFAAFRLRARSAGDLAVGMLAALGCALLFLCPFALWVVDAIPNYLGAMSLAIALAGGATVAGAVGLRRAGAAGTRLRDDAHAGDDNGGA